MVPGNRGEYPIQLTSKMIMNLTPSTTTVVEYILKSATECFVFDSKFHHSTHFSTKFQNVFRVQEETISDTFC